MGKAKLAGVDVESLDGSFKWMEFREISVSEFREVSNRLGLISPRFRPGREIGYIYRAYGLAVISWTTILSVEKVVRKVDSGWVLIFDEKSGEVKYYTHPLRRTKNFVRNLLCHSWLARFRIINRPRCPKCGEFMEITRGRGLKSRYWSCGNTEAHDDGKITHESWDLNMKPKALRFINRERKAKARYRKMRLKKGLSVNQAMLTRKPWRIKNPEI